MAKKNECPRCNNVRPKEWFGDPKAPYAICLSCRVEVNGERKQEKQQKQRLKFSPNCVICDEQILAGFEICANCQRGIELFKNSTKLLGRATSYVGRNLRGKKRKFKKFRPRNNKLQELIKAPKERPTG